MATNEVTKTTATAIMVVGFEVKIEGKLGEVKEFAEILQGASDTSTNEVKDALVSGLKYILHDLVSEENLALTVIKVAQTRGGIWPDFRE